MNIKLIFQSLLPLLAIFIGTPKADCEPIKDSIKVGIIVPLTGPAATWGRETRDGALLGKGQLPENLRNRMEFIFEDDGLQPKETVNAFKKLSSSSNIDFVITIGGGPCGAIAPLADKLKIPVFAITGAKSVARTRDFIFRHWVSIDRQVATIVEQLKKQKLSRVVMVLTENEPPRNFVDAFSIMTKESDINILMEESLVPGDRDFRSVVTKISRLKPDAVVTALLPGHLGLFAKQLRNMDSKVPVFGFSGSETQGELDVAGGALEGMIYAVSQPSEEFRSLYISKYNREPELSAPNAYDIVKLIGKAVEHSCCDHVEMNDFLHQAKLLDGALGNYGLKKDNSYDIQAVAKIVQEGKFVILKD